MVKILLVNRMSLISNLIEAVIENQEDLQVVGKATSVEETVKDASLIQFDIALISARLPGDGALTLTRYLTTNLPDSKVLIFGTPPSKKQVVEYVEAGAAGCIFQNDTAQCLLAAIRAAVNEEAMLAPDIVAAVMERLSLVARSREGKELVPVDQLDLTPREREVLKLMSLGLTNKEIAERLCIQVGTVKNHVHNILSKLGVQRREEAVDFHRFNKD
jgi:two-component system, NarL family, response regulator LiaR